MMGSRGENTGSRTEPTPQVSALAALLEIVDLLRNAEKILPAGLADLRAAAAAAKAAEDALDKTSTDHAARIAEIEGKAKELEHAAVAVADRESACEAREKETARQRTAFEEQKAALAEQKRELGEHAGLLAADRAALEAAKLLHATTYDAKLKALAEDTDRQYREANADIQAIRDDAAAYIREWRANAQAEMATERQELAAREAKLTARQEELQRERVRISALLQE